MKAPDSAAILLTADLVMGRYGNPSRWVARASLVTIADDGTPRNISSGNFFDRTIGWANHLFEAGISTDSNETVPYYHNPVVETLTDTMSYDDIIETAKVVAQVRRRMDAMVLSDGYPANFAEAFVRYAKALGVSQFIVKVSGTSDFYSENKFRVLKSSEARAWLEARVAEFNKSRVGVTA